MAEFEAPPGFLVRHQSFENVWVPAPPRKLSGLSLATSSKLLSAAAFAPRQRRARPAAHSNDPPQPRPARLPPPRPGSPVPLPAELRRTGAAATSCKGRSVPCEQRQQRQRRRRCCCCCRRPRRRLPLLSRLPAAHQPLLESFRGRASKSPQGGLGKRWAPEATPKVGCILLITDWWETRSL